jgi:hypothetical protein
MKPKLEALVLTLTLVGSTSPALAQTLPTDLAPACPSTREVETPNLSQDCFNYNNSSIQHPGPYEAYCGQSGPGCTECVSYPGSGTSQSCYRVGDGDFVICISNQFMPWTQQ